MYVIKENNNPKKEYLDKEMEIKEVIEKLARKNQLFTDSQFKPVADNIGGDFPEAHWERSSKFLRRPRLFVD